jgi:hypothetical protein
MSENVNLAALLGVQDDREPLTMSTSAYEVAWSAGGYGPMPMVLYVRPTGFYEWERNAAVRAGWDELEGSGAASNMTVLPHVDQMFRVLAEAQRETNARLALARAGEPDAAVRAIAASVGEDAVLGVWRGDTITFRSIFASGLAREITGLLANVGAGPGGSVSLDRAVLDPAAEAAGGDLFRFVDELIGRGTPGDQARTLARMMEGTCRRGQFGAAVRDRQNRRHSAGRAVAFHDTDRGRYVMEDRYAQDGALWTTMAPATTARLTQQVQAMLDRLARR